VRGTVRVESLFDRDGSLFYRIPTKRLLGRLRMPLPNGTSRRQNREKFAAIQAAQESCVTYVMDRVAAAKLCFRPNCYPCKRNFLRTSTLKHDLVDHESWL
jgi:hypothetical protein